MTEKALESCEDPQRFFLGHENKTFDGFIEKYGLIPISNDHKRQKSLLAESIDLISSATEFSRKSIRENFGYKRIELRKLGMQLMKAIQDGSIGTSDDLVCFIDDRLGLPCSEDASNLDSGLKRLCSLLKKRTENTVGNFHSSIHKAKGLEAECVLVVAKNMKEFQKWVETVFDKRCKDKQDTCRIGFVGFTRARQILCIACKQPIENSDRDNLLELGVTTVN